MSKTLQVKKLTWWHVFLVLGICLSMVTCAGAVGAYLVKHPDCAISKIILT